MDKMNEQCNVGIYDKKRYYENSIRNFVNRVTIGESINYDLDLINRKRLGGINTKSLKTFLIGGCYSEESIKAMIDFINKVNPDQKVKLLVTDINSEAFDLMRTGIKDGALDVPENITLEMFQGDLTKLGLATGSVDYVRMDYTQNFIPPDKQVPLLKELNRILTDNGIIASMIDVLSPVHTGIKKIKRIVSKDKGSTVDAQGTKIFGYNRFIPSEEFIRRSAKKSGLNLSLINNEVRPHGDNYESRYIFAVFEKPRSANNFTSLKK